jgi:hypothetical protein
MGNCQLRVSTLKPGRLGTNRSWRIAMKVLLASAVTSVMVVALGSQAFAETREAAIQRCRATFGRPAIIACVRAGEGDRESCRAKVAPSVRACVGSSVSSPSGMQGGAGREGKFEQCKALARQRGWTGAGAGKEKGGRQAFVQSCMKGGQS